MLKENLKKIRENIFKAAEKIGREPEGSKNYCSMQKCKCGEDKGSY